MVNLSLEERLLILQANPDEEDLLLPALKLRLWQIKQRVLFDPSAAGLLEALQFIHEGEVSQLMLDDTPSYSHSVLTPDMHGETLLNNQTLFDKYELDDHHQDILFDEELENESDEDLFGISELESDPFNDSLFDLDDIEDDNMLTLI